MAKTIVTKYENSVQQKKLYYKTVTKLLSKMNKGLLKLVHPDGEVITFGNETEVNNAEIQLNNYNLFRKIFYYGDIGFGESYVDGDWDTPDLTNLISWLILNIDSNPTISGSNKKFSPINFLKSLNKYIHKFNNNSLSGSKKNISAHYDLSNEFFETFLDKSMTYSSAYFKNGIDSLETAQQNKYEKICSQLKVKKSDYLLEIGTGWGGFSIYTAKKYGCKIKTITISKEQFKYAKGKIESNNLQHLVEIELTDYRNLSGRFDKIVSIEMLEAVGYKYLQVYFDKINSLLKSSGSLALQVITSPDSRFEEFRKNVDWIQKHIFPGSLLPSVAAINKAVNTTSNLHLHSIFNMGFDYARTLKIWKNNFNNSFEKIAEMGFRQSLIRKWNYYFSYCEAAFKMRNIDVLQIIYTRPNNRQL